VLDEPASPGFDLLSRQPSVVKRTVRPPLILRWSP
jgi:hypothetical protein